MQEQLNDYISKFQSSFLCDFRKRCSTQFILMTLIEKWNICLEQKVSTGPLQMDLSEAFNTINHELRITKFHLHDFTKINCKSL